MTETGSPRCRTCSPREARRRGCCCAKVSPMNGGPGSMAPDRHTPRRTLPDSCSTAARAVSWSTTSCAAIVQTFQRSPQYRRRNAARGAGVITVPHLSMHAGLLRRDSTHVPGSGRRRPPSVRTHHSPELRLSPLAALCETDPVDIRPRRRIPVPARTSARQSRSPSHPRAHSTPPGGAGPAERDRHGRSRALHWPGWRRGRPVTTGHNSRCGWRRGGPATGRRHGAEPSGPGGEPVSRPGQAIARPVAPSGTFLDAPGTALVADAIFTARQERPLIVGDLRLRLPGHEGV